MPDLDDDATEDIDSADLDDLGGLGESEEEAEDGDEYTPPSADEWAKLQRKIKRQEDRITRLVGKPGGKSKPAADVDRELAAQLRGKAAEEDAEDSRPSEDSRWRDIAVRSAAAAQISAAGFSGTARAAERLAKLIDTSQVEPDSDGRFDLEDEIDALREEYPELFKVVRRAPAVRRADSDGRPPKDPTQETSDALLRQAGYRTGRR
jgi:hypothetical protein